MQKTLKLMLGGAVLALASASAFAHDGIGIGLSIAVPGVIGYVNSAPVYSPPPVYVAPPPVYYSAPPTTYYAPPPATYYEPPRQAYYGAPPAVSVYYQPNGYGYRERHFWHRDRDHEDDDD